MFSRFVILYICNLTPNAPVQDDDVRDAICNIRKLPSVGMKKMVRRKRIGRSGKGVMRWNDCCCWDRSWDEIVEQLHR